MAKRDPNPEFNQLPEMTIETVDYNMFYKPEKANVSEGLVQLSKSLQSLVPSLSNYSITEEIKSSEKEKNRAIADYNSNKDAFKNLVKSGKIPEGANPHYFNKMMELDLTNKARKFKNEFDLFASENRIAESLTPDAWNEVYETKLKEFFERENISNYDQIAQAKAFFNETSAFRNEREQQHMAERMAFIKKNTQNNAIRNYSGIFIEAQGDDLSMEDLFAKIQSETKSFMDLGTSGERANDLFLAGFNKYLEVINDQEGFDYARQVLEGFGNIKLGTGLFAGEKGGRRNETIRAELIATLNAKELEFLEGSKKSFNIKEDIKKQNLGVEFFNAFNQEDFDLSTFLNQKVEDNNGELKFKYSNKDQFYLRGLNEALNKSVVVTSSDRGALEDLMMLEDSNPYLVKQKALELARDGKLTNADFKFYFNSTNRKQISTRNEFFILSTPYQRYTEILKNKDIASIPGFAMELPMLRGKFEEDMVAWHRENANDPKYENKPYLYQKDFNAQVKLLMGDILADSQFIQSVYDSFGKEISKKFNIFIEDRRPK
ncbi:hypothetical protein [Candidatus Pelagibacter communis]|uniref:hypothetical protein n=1 Tax=Pelagibacter ubique TaxID=198252 RepID=UPI00094DB1D2|nr:hypothetical protein [Candidatus Pelagibacter ubique]